MSGKAPQRLAVFTTVYPGVERYLADWHRSVKAQEDQDFELWIASDGLTQTDAEAAAGTKIDATWIQGERGDTPADVRNRALARLVTRADAVVLADSDDILLAGRVAAARRALAGSSLAGCALRLADAAGRDLGVGFACVTAEEAIAALPRWNAFGLSNSAYRSDLLKRCLPVSRDAVLIDWLLATRAWLLGAALAFDGTPYMLYRRHEANIASVPGAFPPERIAADTRLVTGHFDLLLANAAPGWLPHRQSLVETVRSDISRFRERVSGDPRALQAYARNIAKLALPSLWWTHVAHPSLSHLWNEAGRIDEERSNR